MTLRRLLAIPLAIRRAYQERLILDEQERREANRIAIREEWLAQHNASECRRLGLRANLTVAKP